MKLQKTFTLYILKYKKTFFLKKDLLKYSFKILLLKYGNEPHCSRVEINLEQRTWNPSLSLGNTILKRRNEKIVAVIEFLGDSALD